MTDYTEGDHRNNDVKDVIVSNSAIPTWRDNYYEEIIDDGNGNKVKRTSNKRNLTAFTAFEERVEKWFLMPSTKEDLIHESFLTFVSVYVWFHGSVLLYDISFLLGVAPMVLLGLFIASLVGFILRKPSLLMVGYWRLFLIAIGVL